MPYRAPLTELRFVLDHVAGFAQVAATPRFAEASPETVAAVLGEAGRLSEETLTPLNRVGDTHPARLENGVVRTPTGFKSALDAMRDGGWTEGQRKEQSCGERHDDSDRHQRSGRGFFRFDEHEVHHDDDGDPEEDLLVPKQNFPILKET